MHAYAEKVAVLEAVVRRMVLQSAGATAEYIEEQAKATSFKLRLTEYAAPGTADGKSVVGLPAHRDTTFLAVLTQNDIDGVEVECGRGEGGWARPALHRVVMSGDKTRYSSILFSSPRRQCTPSIPPSTGPSSTASTSFSATSRRWSSTPTN
jgi:isopenicillin N synthase-like dioxygenase